MLLFTAYIPNTLMVLDPLLVIMSFSELEVTVAAQWYITPSSSTVGMNVYVVFSSLPTELLPLVHAYAIMTSSNNSCPDTPHSKV